MERYGFHEVPLYYSFRESSSGGGGGTFPTSSSDVASEQNERSAWLTGGKTKGAVATTTTTSAVTSSTLSGGAGGTVGSAAGGEPSAKKARLEKREAASSTSSMVYEDKIASLVISSSAAAVPGTKPAESGFGNTTRTRPQEAGGGLTASGFLGTSRVVDHLSGAAGNFNQQASGSQHSQFGPAQHRFTDLELHILEGASSYPIHLAAKSGSPEVLKLFLDSPAISEKSINALDGRSRYGLRIVCPAL